MRPWTRVTIAAVTFPIGLGAGWLAYFLLARPPVPPPTIVQIEAPSSTTERQVPHPGARPSATPARHGCQIGWLPGGYVLPLPAAQTTQLARTLADWIHAGTPASEPAIDPARGLIFARSEDDPGDGDPTGPEGKRVCGLSSSWARYALRDSLLRAELACCDNVCTFGGDSEGAPTEWLVFRPLAHDALGRQWALDAWIEVSAAGLPQDVATANYGAVRGALTRLRAGACPAGGGG